MPGINMTNFKMIYKDNVYNCLEVVPQIYFPEPESDKREVKFLEVVFINSDNRVEVVNDEAFMFQFISK